MVRPLERVLKIPKAPKQRHTYQRGIGHVDGYGETSAGNNGTLVTKGKTIDVGGSLLGRQAAADV